MRACYKRRYTGFEGKSKKASAFISAAIDTTKTNAVLFGTDSLAKANATITEYTFTKESETAATE